MHENDNEDMINFKGKVQLMNRRLPKDTIPVLVNKMLDDQMYGHMLDVIDESGTEDYSRFSDIEMIYLFVHQRRDQDIEKNLTEKTKKEYLRELLWIYNVFIEHGETFRFNSTDVDVYSLFKQITDQNRRLFQDWLNEVPLGRGGKPYSVATISKKTGIFKAFTHFLYKCNYIERPLHEGFVPAKVGKKDRPNREFNSEEALELLQYYKDHPINYALIATLLTTGARVGEIATARICDLSEGDGGYWLNIIGKGNKERELFIFPNVFEAIVRFRKRRRLETNLDKADESPLFTTARQNAYSYKYLSKYLSKVLAEAKVSFNEDPSRTITPHVLRHGFAIISAEQDLNLFKIMKALGHEDISTTMIYLERQTDRKDHVSHGWKDSELIKFI